MHFYKTLPTKSKHYALDGKFYNQDREPLEMRGLSRSFYWSKKFNSFIEGSIDISDIFVFYRIYEIRDLPTLFSCKEFSSYQESKDKIKAISKSYRFPGMKTSGYDIEDLVPMRFLKKVACDETRVLKCAHSFIEKKPWYEDVVSFFSSFKDMNVLREMKYSINTAIGPQNVDLKWQANFRLKSSPGYFNLFNMRKEDRNIIIPQDDESFIYYADFKQFEPRTFFMLHPNINLDFSNLEIYTELAKRLGLTREEAKIQLIAYSYGQENKKLDKAFSRNDLLDSVKDGLYTWGKYPVVVRDSDSSIIHTIVQTISQYFYIEKLQKVMNLLRDKESKFIYPHHDSIIISLKKKEIDLIPKIKEALEDDIYKVQECIGTNLLDLKEIK